MNELTAEFIGTALLILLGNGVVANASLKQTLAYPSSNWVLITFGWGLAVFTGVMVAAPYSGAHINPAVTLGLALAGKFSWAKVLPFILAQLGGAFTGSWVNWVFYKNHFDATTDAKAILGVFATAPAIPNRLHNFSSETIGTFVLVFTVLFMTEPSLTADNLTHPKIGLGAIGALPVALLVVAIGMSLGGTTGYAINPARDLGPRLVHSLVPITHKGHSQWAYAWIPILGPLSGGALAALLYALL